MLNKLRALGAQYSIPLQAAAIALALFQIFFYVPWMFAVNNVLDTHNQALHLGPLTLWMWVQIWGALLMDFLLWFILRVMDADLNAGRE